MSCIFMLHLERRGNSPYVFGFRDTLFVGLTKPCEPGTIPLHGARIQHFSWLHANNCQAGNYDA